MRLLFRFLWRVFKVGVCCLLIGCVAVLGYSMYTKENRDQLNQAIEDLGSSLKQTGISLSGLWRSIPEQTNFVVFGIDAEGIPRTDFMMAGCFNTKDETLFLLSVPRDIYVHMPEERRQILLDQDRYVPPSGNMKLNEVYHYAGREQGALFAVRQIEDLLEVPIDYYATIDLEAFRYIVDEIGGVEFDVPQRMYYNGYDQDLTVDLYPGLQILTGAQAEGLVRYRRSDEANPISPGYAMGDLKRVEVQQDFVKAFLEQLASREQALNSAKALIHTASTYVDTNFSLSDAPGYLRQLAKVSPENISTATIPCTPVRIDGKDCLEILEDELKTMTRHTFRSETAVLSQ